MTPLFETWTALGELWAAAHRAARCKRHRPAVARTLLDLEPTLLRLQRQLRAGSWRPGTPSLHRIADPKPRLISVAPFSDRIVHQALCARIGPLLDRHLIADTYACRVGLGTHAALRRATGWARRYRYFAHLDVRRYFPSIDHDLLLAQLERDIGDEPTHAVCSRIVAAGALGLDPPRQHFPSDDLFTPFTRTVGLPIGNLTSQHFANRFLSPVDHRAKDRLRIRAYLRYMDDMLVFGNDREQVAEWARAIENACLKQRLRMHPWQVHPTRAGVTFVGYRILPDRVRVKRSTVRRARQRLTALARSAYADPRELPKLLASLRSTLAHFAHADSWLLRKNLLQELDLLDEPRAPAHAAPLTQSPASEGKRE